MTIDKEKTSELFRIWKMKYNKVKNKKEYKVFHILWEQLLLKIRRNISTDNDMVGGKIEHGFWTKI